MLYVASKSEVKIKKVPVIIMTVTTVNGIYASTCKAKCTVQNVNLPNHISYSHTTDHWDTFVLMTNSHSVILITKVQLLSCNETYLSTPSVRMACDRSSSTMTILASRTVIPFAIITSTLDRIGCHQHTQ